MVTPAGITVYYVRSTGVIIPAVFGVEIESVTRRSWPPKPVLRI
jgi:hypothetical protein